MKPPKNKFLGFVTQNENLLVELVEKYMMFIEEKSLEWELQNEFANNIYDAALSLKHSGKINVKTN